MFLTGKKAVAWRWVGLVLLAALVASYVYYARTAPYPHGGTAWGLGYGIAAAVLVLVLMLFGWRKRAYRSKLGTLEGWLQAHVVLGVLVLVVALLHTGFRFEDKLAIAALVTLVLVVLSGAVGAAFYTVYPRLLTEIQSNLSTAEISERLNRLNASMARLASGRSDALAAVYRDLVRADRPRGLAGWKLLRAPGRRHEERPGTAKAKGWSRGLAAVPPEEQEPLRQLLVFARQRRELQLRLMYQQRYKNLLDVWLWVHLPLAIALVVLMVAHAVAALYWRGV